MENIVNVTIVDEAGCLILKSYGVRESEAKPKKRLAIYQPVVDEVWYWRVVSCKDSVLKVRFLGNKVNHGLGTRY
jgi:hypothetical protein